MPFLTPTADRTATGAPPAVRPASESSLGPPPIPASSWAAPASDRAAAASARNPSPVATSTPETPPLAKQEDVGWYDWIRNKADNIGQAVGLIDPATYRGRSPETQGAPTISAPPARSWWDRASDEASSMFSAAGRGVNGMLIRGGADIAEDQLIRSEASRLGWSPDQLDAALRQNAERRAGVIRETRAQEDRLNTVDPVLRGDGDIGGILSRGSAMLAGGMVGDANPTYLLAPGATAWQRILAQGGINAGTDAFTQGVEMKDGIADSFDPLRTGANFVMGAGFQGGGELIGSALGRFARNVDPGAAGGGPVLNDVTLDAPGPVGPAPDIEATLNSVGMRSEQFSSPEVAAAMAERISSARGRTNFNTDNPVGDRGISLDRLAAERQAREDMIRGVDAGEVDPSWVTPMPERTIPSDVTIQASPEYGNARTDDLGSMIAVLRHTAARNNVMSQAEAQAEANPVLRAILDAPVSNDVKAGQIWQRISEYDRAARQQAEGLAPIDPSPAGTAPFQRPTVEAASGAQDGIALPVKGRVTSRFGNRKAPKEGASTNHGGIDIAVPVGTPVKAPQGGVVIMAGEAGKNGVLVRIDHGGGVVSSYAHLDGADVKIGQRVAPGEQIGRSGNTGNSTGPHLHYSIRQHATQVDPETFRFPQSTAEKGDGTVWRTPNREGDWTDTGSPAERRNAQASPTEGELEAGKVFQRPGPDGTFRDGIFTDQPRGARAYEQPMATKGDQPFKDATDNPAGEDPAFWERRAQQMQDDLMREYEASQSKRRERQQQEQQQQRKQTGQDRDPNERYKKHGQKPHQGEDGFWNRTEDGFVADKDGNPVAFRNAKEAAKWATKNRMAGDFELHTWGTNSERVVLKKRDGSTYGQGPKPGEGPDEAAGGMGAEPGPKPSDGSGGGAAEDTSWRFKRERGSFEREAPPAGRSRDRSQRQIGAEGERPAEPGGAAPDAVPQAAPDQQAVPEVSNGQAAPQAAPARPQTVRSTGKSEQVVTPTGRAVDTQFEVRELKDLVTSDNPAFDQARQPRDRGRDASDVQVNDIAAKLDPEQLHSSRQAAHGSPIIGPDGMVEVGNGRTMALRRAYAEHPERAAAYKAMLEREGYDLKGMEQPVLVRRRTTELSPEDMRSWVNEAQRSGTMEYSAPEKAKADAGAIKPDTVAMWRGGDVQDAGNRAFVKAWAQDTGADLNAITAKDGSLSREGADRIRASLLHRSFGDDTLVGKLLGDSDNNIKAIGNVLNDLAGRFAKVSEMARDSQIPREFDIAPKIAEMAGLISRARAEGIKLGDLIGQTDIFKGKVDPTTESLVRLMFKDDELLKPRSQVRLREGLEFYLDGAERQTDGKGMFDEMDALKPVDILEAARAKLQAKDAQAGQGKFFSLEKEGIDLNERKHIRWSTLNDELDKIVRGSDDAAYRDLAERLRGFDDELVDVGVGRISRDELADGGPMFEKTMGYASVPDDLIRLGRYSEETMLHEGIHQRLVKRYGMDFSELRGGDAGEGPAYDLIRLFTEARKRAGPLLGRATGDGFKVKYALSSVDEFIAESLTNKAVQRWLQKGPLWARLVDHVRKLFGFPAKLRPMLDDVLRAGNALIDASKKDPVRFDQDAAEGLPSKQLYSLVDKDGLTRDAERIRKAVGDPKATLGKILQPVKDGVSWVFLSADARGRSVANKIKSKAANELLDHFFAAPGKLDDKAVARTYHEAVQRYANGRSQEAYRALEGIIGNAAAEKRVADLLRYPNRRTKAASNEVEAASKLRELFKDAIEYRKAAGEEIGEVSDGYFPRWLDIDKVIHDRDKFLAAATKLYKGLGVDDAKGAAEGWLQHVVDTYAGLDGGLDVRRATGDAVGSRTAKPREFGKAADTLLSDFYQHDLLQVTTQYFHGAARRAEQTRRFGHKGAVGSGERKKWLEDHGEKTQLQVLEDRIREDARNAGDDAQGALGVLQDVVRANLGQVGALSHGQRTAVAWAHTWTQLGVMDKAVLTSIAEMTAGFTRGGARYGLPFVRDSLKYYARQLKHAPPDVSTRWAEALGVVQDAVVNQALINRAGIEGGTNASQKVLAGFYQATTLHQYTEGTRIAAVRMSQELLRQWSHDMASGNARIANNARRFLEEAGIRDPEGFSKSIRDGGFSIEQVTRESNGNAADYGTAVVRITNQAIMRPTRAEKPTWANHPVGSMMFSLMSYSYGFKKNVLDRAGRMAMMGVKEKDASLLMPAAGLALMVAWQGVNDTFVRPALFGGGNHDDESTLQTALRIADRGGLTGALSPIINALTGVRYRRSLTESLAGPVIGRPLDMLTKLAELELNNSPKTNTAERAAAGAVYDNAVEPALDGIASMRLLGAARTAAVLGTGNRGGGIAPDDREVFIEAVAGPKKKGK